MTIDLDKDLDCEECGAVEDSDNYAEGLGWVCDDCLAEWEDNKVYLETWKRSDRFK